MTTGRATVSADRRPSPGRLVRRLRAFVGRHLSVRAKLTIWYGAVCAVTLAAVGMAMLLYADSQLFSAIDASLPRTAADVNGQFRALTPPSHAPVRSPCPTTAAPIKLYCAQIQELLDTSSSRLGQPGQFEQVFMAIPPQFGITALQQTGRSLPVSGANFLDAVAGGKSYLQTIHYHGQVFRAYLTPLAIPPYVRRGAPDLSGALEVLQNEHTYLDIRRTFILTLLLGIPLGLLIALAAGWWIARAALRPINRISRTVHAIGHSGDLSRRLNFVGPEDEVGRLAETFDDMMGRLEKVFETQRRFVADASHELRTPLTAIRGNADLMTKAPPEDREIMLTAIRRESERMTRLVSDLLLLAEADVAEQPVEMRPVDLDELVIDVYHAARLIADDKVTVLLEETDSVCVLGDVDRLKQLLLNLTDNAVKFTPPGGTVSLGVSREVEHAVLRVSDSGVGIAPEEQAAIFERFYRVDTARSKRGSGLGLSICAWVTRSHGGTIDVSSEPGKGSTFRVRLPVAAASATRSAGPPRAGVAGTA